MRNQNGRGIVVLVTLVGLLAAVVVFARNPVTYGDSSQNNKKLSQKEFEKLFREKKLPSGFIWCDCQDYVSEGYREYEGFQYRVVANVAGSQKQKVASRSLMGSAGFMTPNSCESYLQSLKEVCPNVYSAQKRETIGSLY